MFSKIRLALRNFREWFHFLAIRRSFLKIHAMKARAVVFIATPSHGNLGDQAIVYAQYKMFEEFVSKDKIVEIHRYQYERWKCRLQSIISKEDIIVIDGGGNLGTLWLEEEKKMRDIVTRFRENWIFIFPQTAFFSKDDFGELQLQESYNALTQNNKLVVFARDKDSFDMLSRRMPLVHTVFTPDMVMTLNAIESNNPRNNILLCLRSDSEKKCCKEEIQEIIEKKAVSIGQNVLSTTTVLEGTIWKRQRKNRLTVKWDEFSKAQIVITDRLHGMIFAAITGTPCIALDNINHKVYGAYQWIKHLEYIKYCDDVEKIPQIIDELVCMKNNKYDKSPLMPYIENFISIVRSAYYGQ